MNLLVDTSVWSLALRRDAPPSIPQVRHLAGALEIGGVVVTTGLVLQELLQGFRGPTSRDAIVERFAALPLLTPDRQDHIDAAALKVRCRQTGVQIGTIDALIAQLCIRHQLVLLSTDGDFQHVARLSALTLWTA